MDELDLYREEVIRLFTEWANKDCSDSANLADAIIRKFAVKGQKDRCMIKSICFSFQIMLEVDGMMDNSDVHERISQYVGFCSNILALVTLGDWGNIDDRFSN